MNEEEEEHYSRIMGERLLLIRKHRKLSQTLLAKEIGCAQQYIAKWESGKSLIPTKWLIEICKYFDLDFSYFNPIKEDVDRDLEKLFNKHKVS